jgi:hypothetical protein
MAWWLWLLAGLAFFGLELFTAGGFYVMFFGAGALVVGLLVGLDAGGPLWVQWLVFSGVSVASLLLFRGRVLARFQTSERAAPMDTLEGELAIPVDDLAPGAVGRAELRGTSWTAQNADDRPLAKGQRCRVVRVEGLTLFIRA